MRCRRRTLAIVVALALITFLAVSRLGKITHICAPDPVSDGDFFKDDLTEDSLYFEQRHVVYVRIPKTGSSTVTMLLWRFAWTRMLKVLAVKPTCEGTQDHLYGECFFLLSKATKFDIMAEHVFFDKVSYGRYFYDNTVYVTMLRQPLSMLESTLNYIGQFRTALKGSDKVKAYLRNPAGYDNLARVGVRSFTRNPQSSYFGLKNEHFNQDKQIQELISDIESDFPVVMILEKLDESLILLRRVIEWPMKDLIYIIQNVNKKNTHVPVSDESREKYRNWSLADHMLYDHFVDKLDSEIALAGEDFKKELALFRKYKEDVISYCRFKAITDETLYIPKTEYNDAFTVTRKDCALIYVQPLILISSIRQRQFSFPYMSPSLKN